MSSSPSDANVKLLIINPNSSESVTDGLKSILKSPPGVDLTFYNPSSATGAPPSINDITTGVASAQACITDLEAKGVFNEYDGFLVCCFSDHPLTHILREKYPHKPTIGILETSITHSLLIGARFGIITTGTGYKYIYYTDVRNFLGATSERFAGLVTTGLGVVELREGDQEKVKKGIKDASKRIAEMGADVIVLGCAGMAGMEELVKEGVREAGLGEVKVVDGAKAGVEFLAGLMRLARG